MQHAGGESRHGVATTGLSRGCPGHSLSTHSLYKPYPIARSLRILFATSLGFLNTYFQIQIQTQSPPQCSIGSVSVFHSQPTPPPIAKSEIQLYSSLMQLAPHLKLIEAVWAKEEDLEQPQEAVDLIAESTDLKSFPLVTIANSKETIASIPSNAHGASITTQLPFRIDVAAAVIRQASFVEDVVRFGWTHDFEEEDDLLVRAIARYHNFLDLLVVRPPGLNPPTKVSTPSTQPLDD